MPIYPTDLRLRRSSKPFFFFVAENDDAATEIFLFDVVHGHGIELIGKCSDSRLTDEIVNRWLNANTYKGAQ